MRAPPLYLTYIPDVSHFQLFGNCGWKLHGANNGSLKLADGPLWHHQVIHGPAHRDRCQPKHLALIAFLPLSYPTVRMQMLTGICSCYTVAPVSALPDKQVTGVDRQFALGFSMMQCSDSCSLQLLATLMVLQSPECAVCWCSSGDRSSRRG